MKVFIPAYFITSGHSVQKWKGTDMESMRDTKRIMEREIKKGSTPLSFEQMEIDTNNYQEITSVEKLTEVLQNFQREHQRLIDVTWKKKVWQIDVSQILYIQSADNYSQITFYLRGEVVQALQTYTMKEWEQILQEQGFCRISRFVIVNYAYVEDIQKTSLFMEDGTRFVIPNGKVRKLRQEYITYAREHERIL